MNGTFTDLTLDKDQEGFDLTFYFDVEGEKPTQAHVIHLRKGDSVEVFLSTLRLFLQGVSGILSRSTFSWEHSRGKASIAKEDQR